MKILLCGSDGQLGSDCTDVLKPTHEVLPVDLEELDITDPADVDTPISYSTVPHIPVSMIAKQKKAYPGVLMRRGQGILLSPQKNTEPN